MRVGGLQKVSLVDYPALIAAVVFTKGCNFACPFCFNRDLVLGTGPTLSSRAVLSFLKKRKKILDGVVISGGEPLLQPDLKDFIKEIKQLGYQIKLDTNGSLPEKLAKVLKKSLVDYVALDFKAPLDGRYGQTVGVSEFNPEIWQQSLKLLWQVKIPFELRTTIVPGVHDKEVLVTMAKQLKNQKVRWCWQNFQPRNCLDPIFEEKKPYHREKFEEFLKAVRRYLPTVEIRHY